MGRHGIVLILVGVITLTFLPRALSLDTSWSSDETYWLFNSQEFFLSTLGADFSSTAESYHPGITTMWLGGISLWTKYKGALSAAPVLRSHPFLSPSNLARARLTIALITACSIVIAYFLVKKLFGLRIAAFAGIFLAVDPLFLIQSRRLITDALATAFLLLAILALLIFVEKLGHRRYLVISAVCFGLACLSKSSALVLVLLLPFLVAFSAAETNPAVQFSRNIHAFLTWICIAFLTFIVCWPALWVYQLPIGGVPVSVIVVPCLIGIAIWSGVKLNHLTVSADIVTARDAAKSGLLIIGIGLAAVAFVAYKAALPFVDRIRWALTTEHDVLHYFLGEIAYDPGWLFYPLMLSIKSAPLTLPLAVVGAVLLWRVRKQSQYASTCRMYTLLSVFVVLFTLCMLVCAKKFSRYLLPVFPILDILAAIGLSLLIDKITALGVAKSQNGKSQASIEKPSFLKKLGFCNTRWHVWKIAGVTVIALVFVIQVFPVLRLHPYYGTYYNPLWGVAGITRICTTGDASGLDLAAEYLNQKPNAEGLVVHVSPLSAELFGYYFKGTSYRRDRNPGISTPDYEVAYIRDVQIKRVNLDAIDGTLEHVIRLNNVDYVWIYKL